MSELIISCNKRRTLCSTLSGRSCWIDCRSCFFISIGSASFACYKLEQARKGWKETVQTENASIAQFHTAHSAIQSRVARTSSSLYSRTWRSSISTPNWERCSSSIYPCHSWSIAWESSGPKSWEELTVVVETCANPRLPPFRKYHRSGIVVRLSSSEGSSAFVEKVG